MKALHTIVQIAAIVACVAVTLACGLYIQTAATPAAGPFGAQTLGATHLTGDLVIGGNLTTAGDAAIAGTTTMQAMTYTEAVWTGVATFTGTVNADAGFAVDANAFTVADATGNTVIAGSLAANGGITADGTAFTVADTSGNVATTGTLAVTGLSTLTGGITHGGFLISSAATITPTDGGVITPTTSTVILAPAGAVTPTLSACVTDGARLTLYNKNNAAILLLDSTTLGATAAITLGQYDTLSLVCITNVWYELSLSAN